MAGEILGVSVPSAERHLDAAHADFDQSPRREAAAAERRVAIIGPQRRRFAGNVERFQLLGRHHPPGVGHRRFVARRGNVALPSGREGLLDDLQIVQSFAHCAAATRDAMSGTFSRGSNVLNASY